MGQVDGVRLGHRVLHVGAYATEPSPQCRIATSAVLQFSLLVVYVRVYKFITEVLFEARTTNMHLTLLVEIPSMKLKSDHVLIWSHADCYRRRVSY